MGKIMTITELIDAKMDLREKLSTYNQHLNQEPKREWLKVNPNQGNVTYIPIERIEWLLTQLYKDWYVDILETKVIANSVVCTVRLHVLHPLTEEWRHQDGIGASPIITKAGASATDFSQVQAMSVMKAAPAAKSYAVKDAAEMFGKIFGKDLNRKDQIVYADIAKKKQDEQDPNEIVTAEDLSNLKQAMNNADLSEDDREEISDKITAGLTYKGYGLLMDYISANERDRIGEGGRYSQRDIQKKLDRMGL